MRAVLSELCYVYLLSFPNSVELYDHDRTPVNGCRNAYQRACQRDYGVLEMR